jgi:hypothetical protein
VPIADGTEYGERARNHSTLADVPHGRRERSSGATLLDTTKGVNPSRR